MKCHPGGFQKIKTSFSSEKLTTGFNNIVTVSGVVAVIQLFVLVSSGSGSSDFNYRQSQPKIGNGYVEKEKSWSFDSTQEFELAESESELVKSEQTLLERYKKKKKRNSRIKSIQDLWKEYSEDEFDYLLDEKNIEVPPVRERIFNIRTPSGIFRFKE